MPLSSTVNGRSPSAAPTTTSPFLVMAGEEGSGVSPSEGNSQDVCERIVSIETQLVTTRSVPSRLVTNCVYMETILSPTSCGTTLASCYNCVSMETVLSPTSCELPSDGLPPGPCASAMTRKRDQASLEQSLVRFSDVRCSTHKTTA